MDHRRRDVAAADTGIAQTEGNRRIKRLVDHYRAHFRKVQTQGCSARKARLTQYQYHPNLRQLLYCGRLLPLWYLEVLAGRGRVSLGCFQRGAAFRAKRQRAAAVQKLAQIPDFQRQTFWLGLELDARKSIRVTYMLQKAMPVEDLAPSSRSF